MSKEYQIKPGSRIEPVIFEPQRKIKLSRSTYKVNSYIDFKPYKETFKQFGHYMNRFIIDLHDPHYVSTLYNVDRPEGEPPIKIGKSVKKHFGTFSCKQATYRYRIQNQHLQLKQEALKVNTICRSTHQKFLRAIDHMEFHPTLGKPKTGPEVRLKRSLQKGKELESRDYKAYMKDLTDEDVKMLNQIAQLLDTQYLNRTIRVVRIKDNIRTLQEQNLLQQDQIIELTHYLNITYVSSNRYAITNLQVNMAEVNKTLIAALSNVKFVKYSVAMINDIRIISAKLTSVGVMSLEQNVNATYEYLRVLSSKQVNPLIIPPDPLRKVLAQVKEDMKRNPRLQLPEDPNINIWNYYSIMKVTSIVMDDFLLIILTIPLTDQSLEMDVYKIYNLPALHPKLKVEFTYQLKESIWLSLKTNYMLHYPLQVKLGFARAQKDTCA